MSNVIVVTDKYASHAGGTAVCWTEWVRRWPQDQVCVITRRFSAMDAILSPPCRTLRVPYFNIPKLRMPLLWLTMFAALLGQIVCKRPKVIHCAQVLETGWIGLACKALFGIPYVLTLHGEEVMIYSRKPWSSRLLNFMLEQSAGVGVNTRFTEELLRKHTSYTKPVVVAHPGVDRERYKGPHAGWEHPPVLVTLGRLVRRKGHDSVLRVLPRLLQAVPDLRYVIIGSGAERSALEELAGKLGIADQVDFAGHMEEAEVVKHLRSARVFVHPNRVIANGDVEGFGIVFLEANACGLPVIAGKSGGTAEAVADGRSGFLVEPDNEEQLAEKILQLLQDRTLWESFSAFGHEWAAQFTWERSAGALWTLTCSVGQMED